MKTISPLSVLALAFAVLPGTAQTAAKPAAAPAKAAVSASAAKKTAAAPGCSKDLPDLSAKVPALPAGLPCAKPLYTITTVAPAKLSNISPLEGSDLAESLGLQTSTFSLSYIDSKVGTGPVALPKQWYSLHYTGYLPDGTIFDSSSKHPEADPFVFQQGPSGPQGRRSVITGWDTGISGMHIGGKRRLFIPYQLAYGPNGNGQIPAKSWLIFDLELVAQSDKNPSPAPAATAAPNGRPGIPMTPVPPKPSAPTATPVPPAATPVTPAPTASTPAPATTTAPATAAPATTTAPAPKP